MAVKLLSESLLPDAGSAGIDSEMPMISACEVRVSRQRIAELRARVDALVQEMLDAADAAEDAQEHAFLVMFFPLAGKDADAGPR